MARAVAASHHSHHALNHRLADTSGSLKEDERKTPKEVLLEIPPPEDRVLGGKWEKMTITGKGVRWQPKYAVLTKSTLGFAKMITGGGDDKEMSHWMHSKKLSAKDWELEQIFKQFDANGNGELDVLEVQACLEHMKLWSNGEDIQSLFDSLDTDNSASIDIDEFKQLAKWAHATNFVVEYIPLEDISGIEYEIVDIGRKRSVLGIESQETMISRKSSVTKGSIKQCIDAIESILGIDIDGDGEDGSPQLPAWNEATHEFHLRIMTAERGHNSGKTYVHRVSQHDAQAWWELLNKTTRARQKCVARMELEVEFGHSRWALARALTHRMYQSNPFQYTTAFFILMAFALDICESQVLPAKGTYEERVFMALDASLTAIFTAELLVNIFAHSNNGFRPFYTRGWNWFDAFIVIVSLVNVILSYSGTELPNAKILRMLRLARAVRLFSALKDLQRLLAALSLAIYPVCNAFLILLIVASMYAILATTFFSDRLPEYFGDFSTSLFTMFQILSFDSWASGISRGLFSVEGGGNGFTDPKIALFFVSYILVNSIMLLNLVVAVLLDEFITSVEMQKEAAHRREEMEINKRKVVGCLDPLTSEIITFVDGNDLLDRIDIIWAKLDFDNDGQLGFEEFQLNIQELHKAIHVTRDDFDIISDYGAHLGPTAEFDKEQFRVMMQDELWRYSRRQLDNVMSLTGDEQFQSTILMMKIFEARVTKDLSNLFAEVETIQQHLGVDRVVPKFERRGSAHSNSSKGGLRTVSRGATPESFRPIASQPPPPLTPKIKEASSHVPAELVAQNGEEHSDGATLAAVLQAVLAMAGVLQHQTEEIADIKRLMTAGTHRSSGSPRYTASPRTQLDAVLVHVDRAPVTNISLTSTLSASPKAASPIPVLCTAKREMARVPQEVLLDDSFRFEANGTSPKAGQAKESIASHGGVKNMDMRSMERMRLLEQVRKARALKKTPSF